MPASIAFSSSAVGCWDVQFGIFLQGSAIGANGFRDGANGFDGAAVVEVVSSKVIFENSQIVAGSVQFFLNGGLGLSGQVGTPFSKMEIALR